MENKLSSYRISCKSEIAILLATYNGEKYLDQQIQSVVNQSYQNWTLFAHDDGSSDKTCKILESWHDRYPDKIVILSYASQGGACKNFMSLLECVTSDYYMFCDQDDIWHTDKIETSISRMKEVEHDGIPVVVHTDLAVVDSDLNMTDPSFWQYTNTYPEFCHTLRDCIVCTVTGCTMLFNSQSKVIALSKPYDKATMHDAWIAANCIHNGGSVVAIHKPTIDYRQHGDNTLGARPINRLSLMYRIRNVISMQKTNVSMLRMLNSIGHVGLMDFFIVKLRYKRYINECINNNN